MKHESTDNHGIFDAAKTRASFPINYVVFLLLHSSHFRQTWEETRFLQACKRDDDKERVSHNDESRVFKPETDAFLCVKSTVSLW